MPKCYASFYRPAKHALKTLKRSHSWETVSKDYYRDLPTITILITDSALSISNRSASAMAVSSELGHCIMLA